jgi:hypothetical protein
METAMELGFNWPVGPLKIAKLIGPVRSSALLDQLQEAHGAAYAQAPLLRAEAEGASV